MTRLYAEQGGTVSAHDHLAPSRPSIARAASSAPSSISSTSSLPPTLARTSLPLGVVRMDGSLEKYEEGLAPMVPFTSVCNAAGVPAMSVPLEWTEDGLPIGMHFVARYGAEALLFSLAAQLEQAHPWRDRRPVRRRDMGSNLRRVILAGFLAGALSVLVSHQLGFYFAAELGFGRPNLYSMRPVPPWGVPTIVSQAFWGGLWGIVGAFVVPRLPGMLKGPLGWILFATTLVLAVNWFVAPPIRVPLWAADGVFPAWSSCRSSMPCGASACGCSTGLPASC